MSQHLLGSLLCLLLTALSPVTLSAAPPERIVLPDNIATTATSRLVEGNPWAYVVLQPSNPAALANKSLSLHLKPAAIDAAGSFTKIGVIQPVTDPATLGILAQRAIALGDSSNTVLDIIETLAHEWALSPAAVPAEPQQQLAALIHRASQSERDASTLRAISHAHPAIRMALGLAWGGPIAVATGTTCTFEVREMAADGSDVAVLGRCQIVAGQAAALSSPGAPVQVVDLTPEGHLTVKLRWGVPDPLRRQSLQTTGFRVWRVPSSAGLPNPPTMAQLLATPGVKQVTIAPILLNKLYSTGNPAQATDAANFTADPTTYFVADDNGRDDFINTNPVRGAPPTLVRTGTAHEENASYHYYVAALDWLRQPGPLSDAGTGIAVRTLPPPIPQNIQVEEKHLGGAAENIRLQLSFDRNPDGAEQTTATHRYAIYRGDSSAQSMDKRNYLLPQPEIEPTGGETGLNALATVNQPVSGRASFRDDALSPAGNQTNTYWYAVRSIYDTPLGPVYSAPSAPAFGTFHDYRGPAAPGGTVSTDPLQTMCREVSGSFVTSEALPAGQILAASGRIIRMSALRLDPGVSRVTFLLLDPRNNYPDPGSIPYATYVFAPGQTEMNHDVFYATDPIGSAFGGTIPPRLIFAVFAQGRNGSLSYIAWREIVWGSGGIVASTTQRSRIFFECATTPTSQLHPTNPLSAKMLETPPVPTIAFEGDTTRATFSTAMFHGRPAVITTTRGDLTRHQTVRVIDNKLTFADPGRTPVVQGAPPTLYSFRVLRSFQDRAIPPAAPTANQLPPGWPANINWPLQVLTTDDEHFTGDIATPVNVAITTTPETKEYQVYRQVDAAPMTMIAEGVSEHETSTLQEIVIADTPNLPVSGRIGYFARLVDRHGNASPLKQIGPYINILAPTPIPVLQEPVAAGNSASPIMQLSWFCPPQGVRRFHVRLHDLTTGTVVATAPGTNPLAADPDNPLYAMPSPAGINPDVLTQGSSFATHLTLSPHEAPAAPSVHQAEFTVQLDHEYRIEIEAIGLNDQDRPRSLPRTFVWKAPVSSGAVAWPARPLPKVVNGVPLNFQARELRADNPYFQAAYAAPYKPFDGDVTPVIVPLGLIPISSFTPNYTDIPAIISERGMPRYTPDTTSSLYRGSPDPNAHLFPIASAASLTQTVPILPVVLYRQIVAAQGADVTNLGELVQCSPMVTKVAWRNDNTAATVVDPLIVTLPSYTGNAYTAATFWLPDTKPVVAGYTYRYFLVRFDTDNGEIEQVIDCGTVTITP